MKKLKTEISNMNTNLKLGKITLNKSIIKTELNEFSTPTKNE